MTLPPLPLLRDAQAEALDAVVDAFKRVNLVVVEGPTGSGKSILGEAVRRAVAPQQRALYVCTSRILQEQIMADPVFSHAKLLQGRSNYTPLTAHPERLRRIEEMGVTCEDCTRRLCAESCSCPREVRNSGSQHYTCDWCDWPLRCPYREARDAASSSSLAVLNTAYWLTEANMVGRFGLGRDQRSLAIVDECDLLDAALTDIAEVRISERRMRQMGWRVPPHRGEKTQSAGVQTVTAWTAWIAARLPDLDRMIGAARRQARSSDWQVRLQGTRTLRWATALRDQMRMVHDDLERHGRYSGWIRTGDITREVVWRPVWPRTVAPQFLWRHATRWLLMSATVISAEELVERLGWTGPWEVVRMPCTFPVENRPIHVLPCGDMTRSGTAADREAVLRAVRQLVIRHAGERVIVHTVSYALAEAVVSALEGLGRRVETYRSAKTMDTAVAEYLYHPGAVLVAPSLERGLDLPDDACRAQIVAKIPFGDLSDTLIGARLHDESGIGQRWYTLEALRRLIQMSGRGVRSAEDRAETYILDRAFISHLWPKVQYLTPKWWSSAIRWNADPDLLATVGLIPTRR